MVEHGLSSRTVLDYYGDSILYRAACQHSACQLVIGGDDEVRLLHDTSPADKACEGCESVDRLPHLDVRRAIPHSQLGRVEPQRSHDLELSMLRCERRLGVEADVLTRRVPA